MCIDKNNTNNELLLCFDESGNIVASEPRGVIHQKPIHVWHAVSNIWVMNKNGQLLCTMRAEHVSGNGGKWQTYVGGHVKANSNYIETAKREIKEEIGLRISSNSLQLIDRGRREDVMHFYESYAVLIKIDIPKLNFNDGEISKAQWISFDNYLKFKEEEPDMWCNGINETQYKKIIKTLGI
jgi:isopentenyldiphosphate isomerase